MAGLLAGLLLLAGSLHGANPAPRPNIVVILADDLGWNDVSFHGSDQIPTPNIDALAYNGVILNSHYVPALCTPSRASLLTGKYPTTLGMQHLVILAQEPWGLPLEEALLPEHLRRHGYSTHAIGKWHLGFHKKAYTPLSRGFDSFFGYYNGYHDYYDHTMEASDQDVPQKGYDMRRNFDVDYESQGKYSTDAFTDEAVDIIRSHNNSQGPLFLYLAHLAPHTGNTDKPYQAPDEEVARFAHIKDPERRVYAAMVSRLDQSVGKVVTALRNSGKLENSVILFLSDNGAVTYGDHSNHGSNFPLRGLKESPWEGGVRGVAALWSPHLNRTRRVSNQLMHSSDWMPTLFSAAGLDTSELGDIDGHDMWAAISHDLQSPRTEVFNNFDEIENYSSLRVGPWKYVSGTVQGVEVDDWYGDSGEEDSPPPYDVKAVLKSDTSVALSGLLTEQQLRTYYDPGAQVPQLLTTKEMMELRSNSIIGCGQARRAPMVKMRPSWMQQSNSTQNGSYSSWQAPSNGITDEIHFKLQHIQADSSTSGGPTPTFSNLDEFVCDPQKMVCLFHLNQDPCEELNVAHLFPDMVARLEGRLTTLKKGVRKPLNQPGDPLANPALYNGTWTHWCDPENAPEHHFGESMLDSLIFQLLEQMLSSLLLDNVLLKIFTVPIFSIATILIQSIWSLIQSLISLLTVVAFLVLVLFLTNYIKMGTPSSSKQASKVM